MCKDITAIYTLRGHNRKSITHCQCLIELEFVYMTVRLWDLEKRFNERVMKILQFTIDSYLEAIVCDSLYSLAIINNLFPIPAMDINQQLI